MSGMQRFDFDLTIKLEAPVLQSGLAIPWMGFDDAPLLDGHGHLIVSGDQIKGYLHHVMQQAGICTDVLQEWFGREGSDHASASESGSDSGAGERAALKIFDLKLRLPDKRPWAYHRIRLDQETGSAAQSAWQSIAQYFQPGAQLTFVGSGRLFAANDDEYQALCRWLLATFEMVPSLGAIKSAGFGRILPEDKSVCVSQSGKKTSLAPEAPGLLEGVRSRDLTMKFEHPFLIDHTFRSGNIYQSADVIPGSVIKGAIADMLAMGGVLSDYDDLLEQVRILHAYPAETGSGRPEVAPLSLAFEGDTPVDAMTYEGVPPLRYSPDWKSRHSDAVRTAFFLPGYSPYQARTRTKITLGGNRPEEGKLFNQKLIDPKGLLWHSSISLPAEASEQLEQQLAALLSHLEETGIARIGKTAVPASVTTSESQSPPSSVSGERQVKLVLQSPAWLLTNGILKSIAKNGRTLRDAYEAYFKSIAGLDSCKLVDFFSLQSWAGGARYVGPKSASDFGYFPWLMTRAGSVFLIDNIEPEIMRELLQNGLPLPEEKSWEGCPFVPENGYGEVRLGSADHSKFNVICDNV